MLIHISLISTTVISVILEPVVRFTQSMYNVDEDDGPAQPVLVLSNPSSTDITISVCSTDGSATGKNTFNFNPLKILVYYLKEEVSTTFLDHTML